MTQNLVRCAHRINLLTISFFRVLPCISVGKKSFEMVGRIKRRQIVVVGVIVIEKAFRLPTYVFNAVSMSPNIFCD